MAEIKWVKITTNMFDDEKIDFIESLPEADAILIIWIKLLTMAGKCNANGFIFLTEKIPYTTEMLAHKFKRPISIVRLALETLKRLEMIEVDSKDYIHVTNWEKHQNIEGMERVRQLNAERNKRYRERKKQELLGNGESDVSVTSRDGTDIDIDIDIYSSSSSKGNYVNLFKFYQKNIGILSSFQAECLGNYLDDGLEEDLITEAIKDSLGSDNKWRYLDKILKNCLDNRVLTLDQYNAKKVEHENKKQRPTSEQKAKTRAEKADEEFEKAKKLALKMLEEEENERG